MKFSSRTKVTNYIQWAGKLARAEGVINLTQGKPDLAIPDGVLDEVRAKMAELWVSQYSPPDGLPELKQLILDDLHKWGAQADDVIVTAGGAEAGFISIAGLVDPGDEVILISPHYAKHESAVILASGKPVHVPYNIVDGSFAFDINAFERAITRRTKLAIINSPANPTGAVFTKTDLERIKEVCKENDIGIFYDEVYKTMIFDGLEHHTKPIWDPDITLVSGSVSKTFSMSGWRIGYVAGSQKVLDNIKSLHSTLTICPTTISQVAAIAAMKKDLTQYFENTRRVYQERRDVVMKRAQEIPEMTAYKPKGAMYVMMRVDQCNNDVLLVEDIVKKAKVGLVPGTDFGAPGMMRLSLACVGPDKLDEAMTRLKTYFHTDYPRFLKSREKPY